MERSRRLATLVGWAGLSILAAGCQTSEPELIRRPSVGKDPCAERLHDVCGDLLLYYSANRKLPATLAELEAARGSAAGALVCPASTKPYLYNPAGLAIPDRPGRLVLYDPQPSHSGMRWGILVGAPADGSNITARVILVPEKEFAPAGEPASARSPAIRPAAQ